MGELETTGWTLWEIVWLGIMLSPLVVMAAMLISGTVRDRWYTWSNYRVGRDIRWWWKARQLPAAKKLQVSGTPWRQPLPLSESMQVGVIMGWDRVLLDRRPVIDRKRVGQAADQLHMLVVKLFELGVPGIQIEYRKDHVRVGVRSVSSRSFVRRRVRASRFPCGEEAVLDALHHIIQSMSSRDLSTAALEWRLEEKEKDLVKQFEELEELA